MVYREIVTAEITQHSPQSMWVSLFIYIQTGIYRIERMHQTTWTDLEHCLLLHVPLFRSSIRLLKFIVLLLLRWRPTIQIMSSSTTPTDDDAAALGHQDCPVATTNTANNSTKNVKHSLNQEEERVVRCLVWPDILVRYYATSRDSLYHDDNEEETCRGTLYILTHDDVTVSRMML